MSQNDIKSYPPPRPAMFGRKFCAFCIASVCAAMPLAGCQQSHSAHWYMAHGDEMAKKVKECQADAQRAAGDRDCANAMEAFVTWARATGQK
ncbi:MAG: EexN family lipoprotein [Dokdonella sp.]